MKKIKKFMVIAFLVPMFLILLTGCDWFAPQTIIGNWEGRIELSETSYSRYDFEIKEGNTFVGTAELFNNGVAVEGYSTTFNGVWEQVEGTSYTITYDSGTSQTTYTAELVDGKIIMSEEGEVIMELTRK